MVKVLVFPWDRHQPKCPRVCSGADSPVKVLAQNEDLLQRERRTGAKGNVYTPTNYPFGYPRVFPGTRSDCCQARGLPENAGHGVYNDGLSPGQTLGDHSGEK